MKAKAVVGLLAVGLFIFGMTFSADATLTTQTVTNDVATAPTREGADVTYGGATLGSFTGPVSVLRVVLKSDSTAESIDTVRVDINRVDVGSGTTDLPSLYVSPLRTSGTTSGIAIYVDDGDNVFERAVDTVVNVTGGSITYTGTVPGSAADSISTVTIILPTGGDTLFVNPGPLTLFIVARAGTSLRTGDQFTLSTNLSNWGFSKDSAGTATNSSGTITGDQDAPVIAAGNVVTLDDDSDGLLDGVQITWSESIADVSFANFASATATFDITTGTRLRDSTLAGDADGDDGRFTATNRLPKIDPNGSPRTPDTINNNITFITFQEDPGSPADKLLNELNTEAVPTLDMTSATVTDLAGHPLSAVIGFNGVDAARPVIYQSLYLDADIDGKLDEVQVQFSEDIAVTTFADNDGWSATGFTFSGNPALIGAAASVDPPLTATGGVSDVARFLLTEKADSNTSIDPAVDQVTYSVVSGDVADLVGVALNNVFVGTAPEVDKARPVLIDATTKDVVSTEPRGQIDRYTVRFTEAVNLESGDFVLLDDFAIAGLDSGAGTGTVHLTITEAGIIDTGIRPGLAVDILSVEDKALNRLGQPTPNKLVPPSAYVEPVSGNILIPDAARIDGAPPLIRRRSEGAVGGDAVVTGDNNRDGRLDQVVVEFTEIMPVGGDYVSGVTIGGIAPSGASRTAADQVTYTLTVAPGDPPNTGAVPDYLYSAATGGILDPAGLELVDIGSADIAEVDGAAPVLVGAVTDDADGDGKIDKYVITVSEPISIAGVADSLRAGLGVAGHLDTLATLDATKQIITLLFVETAATTLGDFDTAVTPDVTYTRATVQDVDGEIKDLSGPGATANLPMTDIGADNAVLTETDGARPVIVVAADDTSSTGDRNSDGFIDQLTVTFSEPVTADSGNIGITVDATASGNTVTLSEVLSGGGTNVVVFGGTSDGFGNPDTEDIPLFHYVEAGSIRDMSPAAKTLRAAADQTTIDEARPVIMFTTGRVQDTGLRIKFSEAVLGTGVEGDLIVDDLFYENTNGVRAGVIVAVDDELAAINGADELITVTVDSSFIVQDVIQDSISFAPSGADPTLSLVTDAASVPNQARVIFVTIDDRISPTITAMATVDADANGWIDHIRIHLSEPVDDSGLIGFVTTDSLSATIGDQGWDVVGYAGEQWNLYVTGGDAAADSAVAFADNAADDAVLYIQVDEQSAGGNANTGTGDTDATPASAIAADMTGSDERGVSVTAFSGLVDFKPNPLNIHGSVTTPTDAAGPVIMEAKTLTTTAVLATMSEDIDGATVALGDFALTIAGDPNGTQVPATVSHVAETEPGIVKVRVKETDEWYPDLGGQITLTVGSIEDVPGNLNPAPATALVTVAVVSPTIDAPDALAVRDRPDDQGGVVIVEFDASTNHPGIGLENIVDAYVLEREMDDGTGTVKFIVIQLLAAVPGENPIVRQVFVRDALETNYRVKAVSGVTVSGPSAKQAGSNSVLVAEAQSGDAIDNKISAFSLYSPTAIGQALDDLAPAAVAGFTAQDAPDDGGGAINVTWTPSEDDKLVEAFSVGGRIVPLFGVTSYKIMRKTPAEADFSLIGTALPGSNSFVDNTAVTGTTYEYKVIAADTQNDAESDFTRKASAIRNTNVVDESGQPVLGYFGPDDGEVGLNDFVTFLDKFGIGDDSESFESALDIDGDGDIGLSDFVIFLDNFGKTVVTASGKALPPQVGANKDAKMSLSLASDIVKAGEEIIIDASVSSVTNLKGYSFALSYDPDKVEFVGAESGQDNLLNIYGGSTPLFLSKSDEPGKVILANGISDDDLASGEGLTAKIKFRVKSDFEDDVSIAITDGEIIDGFYLLNNVREMGSLTVAITPDRYDLAQNYPNPFNPSTTIEYALPKASSVKLTIYNVAGQAARTLVDDRQKAGSYSVEWDGRDNSGRQMASGIYFYNIKAADFQSVRKMVLIK